MARRNIFRFIGWYAAEADGPIHYWGCTPTFVLFNVVVMGALRGQLRTGVEAIFCRAQWNSFRGILLSGSKVAGIMACRIWLGPFCILNGTLRVFTGSTDVHAGGLSCDSRSISA